MAKQTARTNAVDRHVGARIRERRILLGLTQQQVADAIGVTYQQEHKFERGINRVAAGRLFDIATALTVPVSYFFEGVGQPVPANGRERLTLEMMRDFAKLSPAHQDVVAAVAHGLAGGPQG